jgi:hypothetical protein
MQPPSADALVAGLFAKEQIAAFATLYDTFAHAIDPFDPARDNAEKVFQHDVAAWYDTLQPPKPALQDFRKAIISRCKRHLAATNKPSGI